MTRQRTAFAVFMAGAAILPVSASQAAEVLIVTGGFYTTDLRNQLIASGNTVTEAPTYDAAFLSGFDSVVQYGNTFVDQMALTSFVTAGGTLVWTPWSGLNFSVAAPLQIFDNGGSPIYSQANPGINVLAPGDSMLTGVSFPAPGSLNIGRISNIDFVAGVTQVADWSDGVGMLGYRSLGSGNVVGVNMHVITSDTAYQVINQPWASQLFNNAVNFGGVTAAVPEPSTWAMLLIGFFGLGFAMRRRKTKQKVSVSYA